MTATSRLGELLIEKGWIDRHELEDALQQQQSYSSRLGSILVGNGAINTHRLHQVLAEQCGLPFVELDKAPCDPTLLVKEWRHRYVQEGWIPWRMQDGALVIAVTDPQSAMLERLAAHYSETVKLVITSPFDILWTVQHHFIDHDNELSRERLWQEFPHKSAKHLLRSRGTAGRVFLSLLMGGTLTLFFPQVMLLGLFLGAHVFYAMTLVFKMVLLTIGCLTMRRGTVAALPLSELPVYTILVPLFREQAILPTLFAAIRNLDYPKDLLDVKLVVEADDDITINAIKALKPESFFEILKVPYSLPRTKPKACNYALLFAKGEYVTIYDAEDIPDPEQLKKAVAAFASEGKEVVCVQARLNYYNREENLLTRMFALEYGSWFNFMLPGLEALETPIPLGGTSNHFRLDKLRELIAWDPYNVTEDADLGIRLAEKGYKCINIDSLTLEEAPIEISTWLKQRSRWIKGYMQTYLVHMRHPLALFSSLGLKGFCGVLFFVGAPSVIFLMSPFMWALALAMLAGEPAALVNSLPEWAYPLTYANLAAGLLLQWGMAVLVAAHERWWRMLPFTLLFPLYWVLHSVASFKALWQLITRPNYWEKTTHGKSKFIVPILAPASPPAAPTDQTVQK